jgi:adenine deaminase
MDIREKKRLIRCAAGETEPDFVLKNAQIADVFTETLFSGDIAVLDGRIAGIGNYSASREIDCSGKTVVPGFIDAHVHLESTMTSPSILAPVLLRRGTTAVIADPHEIANVCGMEGVCWLMQDSAKTPLDVFFALPSCVPLGENDHNGAVFGPEDIKELRSEKCVSGLGEVMNCTAVAAGDEDLLEKIELMQEKAIDGHAPGISGKTLQAYRAAGVQTDHECSSWEEALERLRAGFLVQIREGSAAKNLKSIVSGALRAGIPFDRFVFCTDDMHLDDAAENGHIDRSIRMAVELGVKPVTAVKMATLNAARAYGLRDRGAIAPGCLADFVVLKDLKTFTICEVYKNGIPLPELSWDSSRTPAGNKLTHSVNLPDLPNDCFSLKASDSFPVIGIVPGQLTTENLILPLPEENGLFVPADDILKIAVVQRHDGSGRVGIGAVKGFGLKNGAAASTVGHDAHNLIVVGDNDEDMLAAVNELKSCGGGYTLVRNGKVLKTVRLEIAGLFTDDRDVNLPKELKEMASLAHSMGVPENIDVFQNLSFLSLPVIPALRITDSGVYDVETQKYVNP